MKPCPTQLHHVPEIYATASLYKNTSKKKMTPFFYTSFSRAERFLWERGYNELKNIDGRWSTLIDSYNYVPGLAQIFVAIGSCDLQGGQGIGGSSNEYICMDGIAYEVQLVDIIQQIPVKSDGFLPITSMTWNKGDNINDRIKNFHYPDNTPEGGYNHLEVKRYKRAYTLDGVFNAGDPAPPMDEVAEWIRRDYQTGF